MDPRLDPGLRALLRRVGAASVRLDRPVYLVGGAVRDLLSGRPAEDLDFAVEGDPVALARAVASDTDRLLEHRRFLTMLLQSDRGKVEFAACRRERYTAPAALPIVRPAPLGEDLARRDFTVNSMARRVGPRSLGPLIDPTGGQADLERGCLRTHHLRSFQDDPTRAFRAARFAARFGWRLEPTSGRSLRQAVREGLVGHLSGERRRRELERLFVQRDWPAIAERLRAYGLDGALDPRLRFNRVRREALGRLERLVVRADEVTELQEAPRWALVILLACHHWPRSRRDELAAGLRPDRHAYRLFMEVAGRVAALRGRLERTPRLDAGTVERIAGEEHPVALLMAAATSAHRRLDRAALRHLLEWRPLTLQIDGNDLIAAGIEAGPRVALGLRAARRARLAGRAHSAEAQLRAALRELRRA